MHKTVTVPPVTITTAGTRQNIYSTSQGAKAVIIQADAANTGKIFVGDLSVSSANGFELSAKESLTITPNGQGELNELDLSSVYVDTDTNGSVVRIQYLV